MGLACWSFSSVRPRLSKARSVITVAALAITAVTSGCGGGGGGAASKSRSYLFAVGGQSVSISVDPNGRFTVFAVDPERIPDGAGAQGVIGPDGQFVAQGDDTTVQFSGTIPRDGSAATGAVLKNSVNSILFTAAPVSTRPATPAGTTGSYYGLSGTTSAHLTVDTTSHATLVVNATGVVGGGLLNLDAGGELTSSDGKTKATLVPDGPSFTLIVTRLNGAAVSDSVTINRASRARWTVLVFLNAANDLQEFGPLNFNQMEKVGSTADVNIVVQWKQAACSGCGNPPGGWVGTRRYEVKKDYNTSEINSRLVQNMGEGVDMGDWRTLRNFVLWGQQTYPADRYALVIWNHGAGWRNTRGGKQVVRSVSLDDETHTEIQTWDLPQALNVTPKLDMVIFDASLMQMTEVAYEIRDSATYLVGSEESPPGEGYVYDPWLSDLTANPLMTPRQFGTQIVNRTLDSYGDSNNLTQSQIELSKMAGVAAALDTFGNTLMGYIVGNETVMENARNDAQNYGYFDNKDLWDYAELIKAGTKDTDVKSAAAGVQNAISAAVVAERHGTHNGRSHGLAIYVPSPTNYLSTYASLSLSRVTSWPQWLQNQP